MKAINNERGAALVVAILVMLVLSAMGLVALQAAVDGTWMSGTYRVNSQSNAFSDSVVGLGLYRSGTQADGTYSLLRQQANFDANQTADDAQRAAAFRRGGYRIYTPDEDPGEGKVSLHEMLGGERFLEPGAVAGVESIPNMEVEYRYIVRDPMLGPAPPGYDENYCLIRVMVASEVIVGRGDSDEQRSRRKMRGVGRNAADAFIGPVPCGG